MLQSSFVLLGEAGIVHYLIQTDPVEWYRRGPGDAEWQAMPPPPIEAIEFAGQATMTDGRLCVARWAKGPASILCASHEGAWETVAHATGGRFSFQLRLRLGERPRIRRPPRPDLRAAGFRAAAAAPESRTGRSSNPTIRSPSTTTCGTSPSGKLVDDRWEPIPRVSSWELRILPLAVGPEGSLYVSLGRLVFSGLARTLP